MIEQVKQNGSWHALPERSHSINKVCLRLDGRDMLIIALRILLLPLQTCGIEGAGMYRMHCLHSTQLAPTCSTAARHSGLRVLI